MEAASLRSSALTPGRSQPVLLFMKLYWKFWPFPEPFTGTMVPPTDFGACTFSNNLFYSAFNAHWLPAVVTTGHVVIAQTHWRHFPAVLQLLLLSRYVLLGPLTPLNLLARLHIQKCSSSNTQTHLKYTWLTWFFFAFVSVFEGHLCICPCWPLHNS